MGSTAWTNISAWTSCKRDRRFQCSIFQQNDVVRPSRFGLVKQQSTCHVWTPYCGWIEAALICLQELTWLLFQITNAVYWLIRSSGTLTVNSYLGFDTTPRLINNCNPAFLVGWRTHFSSSCCLCSKGFSIFFTSSTVQDDFNLRDDMGHQSPSHKRLGRLLSNT